jgi:hypothetical protein
VDFLTEHGVHVAAIQETNLHPTSHANTANHLQCPDDWAFGLPSSAVTQTNKGKGVALVVNSSVRQSPPSARPKPLLVLSREVVKPAFEVLAGRVAGVTVVSVYMHCSTTDPQSGRLRPFSAPDIDGLVEALLSVPDLQSPTSNVVVGGDFNFPASRPQLEEAMASVGLHPVYDPQHPPATRGAAALDLVFFKGPDIRPVSVQAVTNPTSDHRALVVDFEGADVASAVDPDDPAPPLPDWSKLPFLTAKAGKEAKDRFVEDAREALEEAVGADDPVTAMGAALLDTAVKHFGAKKWRRQHRLPWWNRGLTRLNRKLRRAKVKAAAPSASDQDQLRLTTALKAFQAAVQKARRQQASNLAKKFKKGDINFAWAQTGRHRGKKTARYLKNAVANPSEMVEFWETYFTDTTSPRPEPAVPDPDQPDLFTEADVNQAILKMRDKTPGVDGLRVSLLKVVGPEVADLLADGYNRASRVTVDNQSKTSTTVFLQKRGGCATCPADYRPVALQPVTTKLLEKMVEQKIWQQVEDQEVHLSDEQGGFRPHRSRFDLILLLRCVQDHYHPRSQHPNNRRRKAKARRLFAAFLDVKKAYDSVPHHKIVEVLRKLGVREELVRLVADLLTNRYTTIYGKKVGVTKGVPQGSPLSPLLFILAMMQPLSAKMQEWGGGGALLPGGLVFREGFYADDVVLVAETPDQLQQMLKVCDTWALEVGLQFNVPKSKVMVLTGARLAELPALTLSGQPLGWVDEFKYLGFPLYAYNQTPKNLPVDLSILNNVLFPLAPTLLPNNVHDFYLANRVDVLTTMVESKVLHNSPAAGVLYKEMDAKVNKWLGSVAGVPINAASATFLRCEFGVLPSQLVAERNALYYLWHLRNEVWYREFLPALQHLPPVARLTGLLLDNNITLEEFHQHNDSNRWHSLVKAAVLCRAQHWHDVSGLQERLPATSFVYRGQQHLRDDTLADLAGVAVQLRTDRLPGVPNAWEHQQCPLCNSDRGLNGAHLLQCDQLPPALTAARDELRAGEPLPTFAARVLRCKPSAWTRKSLCLGFKIIKVAQRAAQGLTPPSSPRSEVAGEEFLV